MLKITTHTIVKNEENWVWYSLMSVKDLVHNMLVFDDASTDKTWEIIQSISDPKIKAERGSFTNASEIRNKMLSETKTDWYMLLDGDEVWNQTNLKKCIDFLEKCPKDIYGVFVRTRNCVGDVFHYQPELAGKYHVKGMTGNFNMRAFRNLPGFKWGLDYPQETYFDNHGLPVDKQDEHISFFDTYYWHMTFLPRTSVSAPRKYRQVTKLEKGISIKSQQELPEVFFAKKPDDIPDPIRRRGLFYELAATVVDPLKVLKRQLDHE